MREMNLGGMLDRQQRAEQIPIGVRIQRFVEDVERVRQDGSIMLFVGEARPSLYNATPVMDAMRDAVRFSRAKIKVITGPMVMIAEDGTNGLLQLREEGLVDQMLHRSQRSPSAHFRVVEAEGDRYRSVSERLHPPLPDLCYEIDDKLTAQEKQWVGGGVAGVFDSWSTLLQESEAKGTSRPHENPLLVTEQQLKAIIDTVPDNKKDLYYHTKDELTALLPV